MEPIKCEYNDIPVKILLSNYNVILNNSVCNLRWYWVIKKV